jgi:hypothetical protein
MSSSTPEQATKAQPKGMPMALNRSAKAMRELRGLAAHG